MLPGTSLVVQWFRLHASSAGGAGWIPGQELKSCTPHGAARKLKKNKTLPDPAEFAAIFSHTVLSLTSSVSEEGAAFQPLSHYFSGVKSSFRTQLKQHF